MAKSKRCLRRVIKLSVLLICTAGFLYQIWRFLQIYLAYPTMQITSEEQVDLFRLPAVTICNRNRFSRTLYCDTYPQLCSWKHITWESFCGTYRKQCPERMPPDFNRGIPNYHYLYNRYNPNELLKTLGRETELNLIEKCVLYEEDRRHKKCNSSIVIQVPHHGYLYNCFSFFSLLGKQYDESLNGTYTHSYEINMNLHSEEYMNPEDTVQASVVIHDPRKLVNPMTEGVTLSAGNYYMIYPTMEIRTSLPPPYVSKCRDYLTEWKKNGGHGPLSKYDCIDVCKIKAMTEKYGCVLRSMTYPNNHSLCPYHRITGVSSEVNRRCSSICQDACKEYIYPFTFEPFVNLQAWCKSGDEHCKNSYLQISINFNRMRFKKFQQIPRFESIELFSYIGGYLGMWLGISIATLFDFAEAIYDIVYPLMKGKRKKKTTTLTIKVLPQTVKKKRRKL